MIEDLQRLAKSLDEKVKPLVDAIEKADPLTSDYEQLMKNFNHTLTVSSNINRMLLAVAAQAAQSKKEEEKKDESNN